MTGEPVDVDAIEARWADATVDWDWIFEALRVGRDIVVDPPTYQAIAHAPEDIAALVAEVRRLREADRALDSA